MATFSTLPELCPGPSRGGGRLKVRDSSPFSHNKGQRREVPEAQTLWSPASGCHFNCLAPGRGLRLVVAKDVKCQLEDNCEGGSITSIQLCEPDKLVCSGNTKLLDLRGRKSVGNGRYIMLYIS